MKKLIPVILVCLILLSACAAEAPKEATEPVGQMQIGNPWKTYTSLADAENACDMTFPIPENILAGYGTKTYQVMSGSLLEVTYKNDESEITVRMQSGNDLDISGVYETFQHIETTEQNGASVTRKQAENCLVYLIHLDGYSYSIYATSLTVDDACREILSYIC